ncbi:MAG: hypothetical protein VYC39_03880, partial [Myxococcota bacterium]|nr:hypothetical protein [Myxococcota bacterium]
GYKADGTPTGEVMSVGNGDYNVRVKNHLLNEGNIYIGKSSGSNRLDINTNSVTSGIDLDGRDSLTGFSGDSWLRLNQSGHWGSGVYTPGHFRADGEIRQGGSDYGGYNIQTNGTIYAENYIVARGGLKVGPGADPGTNNLRVDGSSSFERVNFRHLRPHGVGGNSGAGHDHYAIYQEPGAWSHPYPDMVINYHTGIKMVGYHGYNGIRMYAGYNPNGTPTGEVMSVGNGDYNVRVANRIYVGDAVCIRGACRTSWPSGGSSGYQFIKASAGGGNNGVGFPENPYGGGGDDAWLRYYRDGGGEDTALQLGISNDGHDEMELYSGGQIELYGPGGTTLGFNFPNNRWGGGGDDAWMRYYSVGGEATRLELGIVNDNHDHLRFFSDAMILIDGHHGNGNAIGFDFQNDRWGGGGDDAWMRLERRCGGECYKLSIGVRNDGHDIIELSSSGGTYFNGRRRFDIAEQVAVSESVEAGDILTIDENNVEMFRIARSSDTRFIAGVVAYEPAIVLGDKEDGTPPVTLAGNTPVKVTLENGPINPGDTLVLSTTPGHAMKGGSCDNCAVIGVALESFSGDSEHGDRGYVRVWISPTTSQGAANTKSPTQDSAAVYEKRIEDLEARIKKLETLLESGVQ